MESIGAVLSHLYKIQLLESDLMKKILLLTLLLIPTAAFADSFKLNVDDNGILTGARNVIVGGIPYDVDFVDGTCESVFGICDVSHFIATDAASATLFSQALLDQVLIDGPAGAFDSLTSTIFGCGPVSRQNTFTICLVFTPYGTILGGRLGTEIRYSEVANWYREPDENLLSGSLLAYDTTDTTDGNQGRVVWARWAAVPEPSTLELLPFGLLGVATLRSFYRKSQRRKAVQG
jgi:hypothetical protein